MSDKAGSSVVSRIKEIQGHAQKYMTDATDLATLARMAGDKGDFDLEHSYQQQAYKKLVCAKLVSDAANRMLQHAVDVCKTVLKEVGE